MRAATPKDKTHLDSIAAPEVRKRSPSEASRAMPLSVAIKTIDRSALADDDASDVEREINIMREINHENVVRLYEVIAEPSHLHLVLELCTGGELFDRIIEREKYTERDARDAMENICSALAYLHAHNITHRDIKPENLLLAAAADDAPIKLADFGFARQGFDQMKTACGTPGYVAPEVISNRATPAARATCGPPASSCTSCSAATRHLATTTSRRSSARSSRGGTTSTSRTGTRCRPARRTSCASSSSSTHRSG